MTVYMFVSLVNLNAVDVAGSVYSCQLPQSMESVHPGVVYLGLVFMLPQGGSFVYLIIIISAFTLHI